MAKIFIGSSDVPVDLYGIPIDTSREHLFLLYDYDGDETTTNDQYIIEGVPSGDYGGITKPYGDIIVTAGASVQDNDKDWDLNDDGTLDSGINLFTEYHLTELDLNGADATNIWSAVTAFSASMGSSIGGDLYNTDASYSPLAVNSNSVINTILNTIGIDVRDVLPYEDGNSSNDRISPTVFTGHMGIIDGSGDDVYTIPAYNGINDWFVFKDWTGNDIINVEVGAKLWIINDDDENSSNTIVLKNVDVADVTLSQDGDDLTVSVDGIDVVILEDHFSLDNGTSILKIDDGVTVTTKDLTSLTSSDLESTTFQDIATWFSTGGSTFYGLRQTWDPLVIDLDGDGITTDAIANAAYFDLDNNGYAELTGWAGADDGFLVRDLNANGRIDDGGEMFGTETQHGFAALAAFDANGDGVINSGDAIWSDLLVWRDANSDGLTQSDELLTLASLNITGVDLANVVDEAGAGLSSSAGRVSHTSTVTTTGGTLAIGNYYFDTNQTNTRYAEDYNFDIRAAFLPTLRGYNDMADLHIAISLDNDENDTDSLMAIALDIASYGFAEIFENWVSVTTKIEDLLYRWAGVDNIDPDSRGDYVDARQVAFLEKYLGEQFIDNAGWGADLGIVQAKEFETIWGTNIFPHLMSSILVQTQAGELIEQGYDFEETRIENNTYLTINQSALDILENFAENLLDTATRQAFWIGVGEFIMAAREANNQGQVAISSTEKAKLKAAIENSDTALTWNIADHDPDNGVTSIEYRLYNPTGETIIGDASANDYRVDSQYNGTSNADFIQGLGGDDYLHGQDGDDVIEGGDGNDTLFGGSGYDILYGGDGNDVLNGQSGAAYLIGGAGDDWMSGPGTGGVGGQVLAEGGDGDDTYEISGGIWIDETTGSGNDTVYSNSWAVSALNVTMRRVGNGDLEISTGSGTVVIRGHFNSAIIPVETFFADYDDTSIDLTTLTQNFVTYGSEFDDVIDGIESGGGTVDVIWGDDGNDIISGGTSNDSLYGEEGNDTLNGGDGDDLLVGGNGNDTYIVSAGNDTINISSGYETLVFEDNTKFVDLDFDYYYGTGNVLVLSHGTGTITLQNGYQGAAIDEFQFTIDGIVYNHDIKITQHGTSGNDTIVGISTALDGFHPDDTLYGYDGNDTFSSGDGDDKAYGGDGNDIIRLSSGNDYAEGGAGNDKIEGETGTDILYGGDGDDELYGYSQYGGGSETSSNQLYGDDGNDYLQGDDGNDLLNGGSGNDSLRGGYGDDTYIFSSGMDSISQELGGVDKIVFGSSIHIEDLVFAVINNFATIIYNSGVDELKTDKRTGDGRSTAAQRVDILEFDDGFLLNWHGLRSNNTTDWSEGISTGTASANVLLGLSSDDSIDGLAGDDTVHGRSGNDILDGGDGDDQVHGGDGDDIVIGGDGNDILWGGDGSDTASYASSSSAVTVNLAVGVAMDGVGNDVLFTIENITGSSYGDTLIGDSNDNVLAGLAGNDILDGGMGTDTADYSNASAGVTLTLHGGNASDDGDGGTDTLINLENVIGSAYGDSITGNNGDNALYGGGGHDYIYGRDGHDVLYGGDGDDVMTGNEGDDTLWGGTGHDTLYGYTGNDIIHGEEGDDHIQGHNGDDLIYGGAGIDDITGGSGADEIHGGAEGDAIAGNAGNDTLYGDDGDDNLYGGEGDDTLYGGSGNDFLRGNEEDDILYGDAGSDTLRGDAGNDILHGESGADYLYGGTGDDVFAFEAATAFSGGYDYIQDFTIADDAIDISDLLSGYDPLNDALSDFVQITEDATHTWLRVDMTGSGSFGAGEIVARLSHTTDVLAGGSGSVATGTELDDLVNAGVLVVV